MSERIKTKTAAKILGASTPYVIEMMAQGRLPIGEYRKNGKVASVYIYAGPLAAYLMTTREEIFQQVKEIESGIS